MSDVIVVALISAAVTTIGAILTVVFVSRKVANAEEIKAKSQHIKDAADAEAREAEIDKLKDEVTSNVLARAREENVRLTGRIETIEARSVAKDLQIQGLRQTQAEQGHLINNQRDQIVSLIEQLSARNATIAQMKAELERQASLILDLQKENETLRVKLDNLTKQKEGQP